MKRPIPGKTRCYNVVRFNWMLVIAIIYGLWLALMIGASYFSYEYRLPVRIENWKPEPAR